MAWIIAAIYLVGAVAFSRLFVRYNAREWPNLYWAKSDTFFCLYLGALWPFSLVPLAVYHAARKFPRDILPFARWHEADKRRFRDSD